MLSKAVTYSRFIRSIRRPRLILLCFVFLASLSSIYFDFGPIIAGRSALQLQGSLLKEGDPEPRRLQEFDSSNLTNYDQKDPNLVNFVRYNFITEPSSLPYTFSGSAQSSIVQTIWPILEKIVDPAKKGFFVEAGAGDGLIESNTLWLERTHGWNGLLVECHPESVPKLREKHRKAYISHACLSASSHPTNAELVSVPGWPYSSSIVDKLMPDFVNNDIPRLGIAAKLSPKKFNVQAIPLYTLLAAFNVDAVDFISLDVQSIEYEILKDFPFDLILVKVWVIEVVLLLPETKIKLRSLMTKNGYLHKLDYPISTIPPWDEVYIHKSIER